MYIRVKIALNSPSTEEWTFVRDVMYVSGFPSSLEAPMLQPDRESNFYMYLYIAYMVSRKKLHSEGRERLALRGYQNERKSDLNDGVHGSSSRRDSVLSNARCHQVEAWDFLSIAATVTGPVASAVGMR